MMHDESPVTAAQLEQLLQAALQPIKEDIHVLKQDMHARFEWLHQGIDRTIILIGNIEKRLETKIDNHERRIKRLEKNVGFAQVAA